jgi:hypothetical protein
MTDFGLLGKTIDFIRSKARAHDEKRLQERFVAIVRGLRSNCYAPPFGSPEYWEAEKMADKGWFNRMPPFGYMLRGIYNPRVLS